MYGVVVCPHCTLVQGADLSMARVSCPRCGGKIDVRRAKVYFSTDSPQELGEAVRQVGEQLVYDIEAPEAKRRKVRVKVSKTTPALDEASLRQVVESLSASKGEFGRDDLGKALQIGRERELDRLIARMLAAGLMAEAGEGRYRAV